MQIKLNQNEIQQALAEFIQKRSSSKITLTAFDLKGMRSEEGYHANIEIEYEDVSYEEFVPKLVSFAKTQTSPEPVNKEPKQSEPEYSQEEMLQMRDILELMRVNVNHSNTEQISSLVQTGSDKVKQFFETRPDYQAMLDDFTTHQELAIKTEVAHKASVDIEVNESETEEPLVLDDVNKTKDEAAYEQEQHQDQEPDLNENDEAPFDTGSEEPEEKPKSDLKNLFAQPVSHNSKTTVVQVKPTNPLFG